MSTSMAVASSSSLNPNAPLFIPAAYRQVEDFSPRWWDLVQTTAWFRDHWFRQHHQLREAEAEAQHQHAVDAALPDDLLDTEALFYAPDHNHHHRQFQDLETHASPRGGAQSPSPPPWQQLQQPRYADKPAQQHVGFGAPGRRVIHQPR